MTRVPVAADAPLTARTRGLALRARPYEVGPAHPRHPRTGPGTVHRSQP